MQVRRGFDESLPARVTGSVQGIQVRTGRLPRAAFPDGDLRQPEQAIAGGGRAAEYLVGLDQQHLQPVVGCADRRQ